MDFLKDSMLRAFRKHIVIICSAVVVLFILGFLTDVFRTSKGIPQFIWLFGAVVSLGAIITILLKVSMIHSQLAENNAKLEQIGEVLEKSRVVLSQLCQSARLSESVKSVVFHDADRQALRETVFDKLQQKDFDVTYQIIGQIANLPAYNEFASQLRTEVDEYRSATDQERINQIIAHIEKLLDGFQWAKASTQIEQLIKSEPSSEKAKAMRQKLLDNKEQRKKVLLTAWDDAVNRRATDRGLEILRELDLYLTPSEGLALQEAAKDVFRNKLHNLGVQFSIAVSEMEWDKALQIGRDIIRGFPNSKMAEEIREKIQALEQRVSQQPR